MRHIELLSIQTAAVDLTKQSYRGLSEFGAMVRMCDRDQFGGALAMVLSQQPRDSKFGHDCIGEVARDCHQRARLELRHDSRDCSADRGGLQQRYRPATGTEELADMSFRRSPGPSHHA